MDLTVEQARLYRPIEKALFDLLLRRDWTYEPLAEQVLALITELRELADAAQLVAPHIEASSKLTELEKLVPDLLRRGP